MKNYTFGSHEKVSWKCSTGKICHIWDAIINSRTSGINSTKCPFCYGFNGKICIDKCNSLFYTHPQLRNEWNDNIEEMKNYTFGSHEKVSWKCEKNHKWYAKICSRTNMESGCPKCNSSKLEKFHQQILTNLQNNSIVNENSYSFSSEIKNKEIKEIKNFPFDFQIKYNNKIIYCELQGKQHYTKIDFFHKTDKDFQYRLDTDILKNFYTVKKHSYISFSYLAEIKENNAKDLEKIYINFMNSVNKLSDNETLCRYYITNHKYVEILVINESNNYIIKSFYTNVTKEDLKNDDFLIIYQQILINKTVILENNTDIYKKCSKTFCELCKEFYIDNLFDFHLSTDQHNSFVQEKINELQDKYEDKIVFTCDIKGSPIFLAED
jgi:hypothetical protein